MGLSSKMHSAFLVTSQAQAAVPFQNMSLDHDATKTLFEILRSGASVPPKASHL
jgi:hypothetical protein